MRISSAGEQCLHMLRQHAMVFDGALHVSSASVVDEFERDVELQQEQEQELELLDEQRVPLLDTVQEQCWRNIEAALSLPSARDFSIQQCLHVCCLPPPRCFSRNHQPMRPVHQFCGCHAKSFYSIWDFWPDHGLHLMADHFMPASKAMRRFVADGFVSVVPTPFHMQFQPIDLAQILVWVVLFGWAPNHV